LASHLSDENKEKNFTIWLGDGCNGKSTLNHLMQAAFGPKAVSLSSECLIKSLGPEENDTISVAHYVSVEEPDEDTYICTDYLKSLIANNARFHMECTSLPKFDKEDEELAKRIRVIPFATTIQTPVRMSDKIQYWAPHFFARLQRLCVS
jgi:phage/plasmid-associated DNA primase